MWGRNQITLTPELLPKEYGGAMTRKCDMRLHWRKTTHTHHSPYACLFRVPAEKIWFTWVTFFLPPDPSRDSWPGGHLPHAGSGPISCGYGDRTPMLPLWLPSWAEGTVWFTGLQGPLSACCSGYGSWRGLWGAPKGDWVLQAWGADQGKRAGGCWLRSLCLCSLSLHPKSAPAKSHKDPSWVIFSVPKARQAL